MCVLFPQKSRNITFLNCGKMAFDEISVLIPPAKAQKLFNRFLVKAPSYHPSRNSADYRVRFNVLCHNRPCADYCAVSDCYTGENDRLKADPDVVPECNVSLVVPRAGNVLFFKSPFLKKERERIA